jgi:peptidoglycan/LPS O-acetylase OafA/YrhL
MTDKVADRSYVAGLDGLRAIAVGTVFIGHAFTNVISSASGVDMFFALSGFLITRGLINQGEKTGVSISDPSTSVALYGSSPP